MEEETVDLKKLRQEVTEQFVEIKKREKEMIDRMYTITINAQEANFKTDNKKIEFNKMLFWIIIVLIGGSTIVSSIDKLGYYFAAYSVETEQNTVTENRNINENTNDTTNK